jgi:ATP-dependent exoDNAse (exonuclease V) alpha subunit
MAFTHETRKIVNSNCMRRFIIDKKYISAKANLKDSKSQLAYLCVGLPIMAHTNNKKLNIYNSIQYNITAIDEIKKTFTFTNDINEIHTVDASRFNYLFYVSFCITIHASQGATFNTPYTIYDWSLLNDCLKYVALSRSTDIKNIIINQ